jgi:hypothetical protein
VVDPGLSVALMLTRRDITRNFWIRFNIQSQDGQEGGGMHSSKGSRNNNQAGKIQSESICISIQSKPSCDKAIN